MILKFNLRLCFNLARNLPRGLSGLPWQRFCKGKMTEEPQLRIFKSGNLAERSVKSWQSLSNPENIYWKILKIYWNFNLQSSNLLYQIFPELAYFSTFCPLFPLFTIMA